MPRPRADRVAELAAQLGEPPAEVAATLYSELRRALADIDAGLADGDHERVGHATHAARNSVLMLDDQPMLDVLRALDAAAAREDRAAVRASRAMLDRLWEQLAAELRAI